MMRGRKRRSGSARLRLRWSLDMRRGPWKVSEETQERLANICPLQSKLCYFGAEMLATAMFPRRGVRACAKRCAADSRCKNRSATTRPPRPQPPDHTTTKQVDACSFGNMSGHMGAAHVDVPLEHPGHRTSLLHSLQS